MPSEFLIFLEVIVPNVSNVIRNILGNIVGKYKSDIKSRGDVLNSLIRVVELGGFGSSSSLKFLSNELQLDNFT